MMRNKSALSKRELSRLVEMLDYGLTSRCPVCGGCNVSENADGNWAYCNSASCMVKWSRNDYRRYEANLTLVTRDTTLAYQTRYLDLQRAEMVYC